MQLSVSLHFSSYFNTSFLCYLSSLAEIMFKPLRSSLHRWLDPQGSSGGPSAGMCALRGTNVSYADECLCEEDSVCVITNKPPAQGGSKRGKITRWL